MGVGAGLYMYDVVVKSSRLLSDLLMSFLLQTCIRQQRSCMSSLSRV